MSYKSNFLSQVIFQANYNPIDPLKTTIADTLVVLCERLTSAKKAEGKNNVINILNNKVTNELNSTWLFNGNDIQIGIQPSTMQISTKKYQNHDQFHAMINEVFDCVRMAYKAIITKASLRYINNIHFSTGSTFDFDGLIDPDLLCSMRKFTGKRPSRSMGNMVLTPPDSSITTIFNYGFFNSQFPNLVVKREFVLDYDCQCQTTERDDLINILLLLRDNANDLFESSIADGLRQIMNT
jgi:uncharacterized protein (TIGR04255 family)